jgi:hypothetical protein
VGGFVGGDGMYQLASDDRQPLSMGCGKRYYFENLVRSGLHTLASCWDCTVSRGDADSHGE